MKNKVIRCETILLLAAAFILFHILMVKPIMGVADNGDFARVIWPAGIDYLTADAGDRYFKYMHPYFNLQGLNIWGFSYSFSEMVFIKLAMVINMLAFDRHIFDIRFLSGLYSLVFLGVLYVVFRYNKQKHWFSNLVLAAVLLLIFTDVGYIAYFNSFYGEAMSLLFLGLILGIALLLARQERPKTWLMVSFFAAALFFVNAKLQNSPLGILIALFGLRFLWKREDKVWRRITVGCSVFLMLFSIITYAVIPRELRDINIYQSVFFGILKDSPSPEKDLEELGLSKELTVLAGTNYFMTDVPIRQQDPIMRKEFYPNISHTKVLLFYMKHPDRYMQKLEATAKNAFAVRQGYLGNYAKEDQVQGDPKGNLYGTWGRFKRYVFPHRFLFILLYFAAYFGVLITAWIRRKAHSEKLYVEALLLLGVLGVTQYVIPVLGDGEADISKHLFLFNVCFDMMFVGMATWISCQCTKLFGLLKNRHLYIQR